MVRNLESWVQRFQISESKLHHVEDNFDLKPWTVLHPHFQFYTILKESSLYYWKWNNRKCVLENFSFKRQVFLFYFSPYLSIVTYSISVSTLLYFSNLCFLLPYTYIFSVQTLFHFPINLYSLQLNSLLRTTFQFSHNYLKNQYISYMTLKIK